MNARNALLRGVGAAFDNGEAIETLADDINLMLDQQIRPYLQSDGGDLHVLSLVGDQLVVDY